MKLKVTDQILVTAIQPDVLVPGTVVEVTKEEGEALLKRHPGFFAEHAAKAARAPKNKAAPVAQNKGQGGAKPPAEKESEG